MTKKNNNIWIDTDLAVGEKRTHREGYSDVDDGYAVLQLFKEPSVKIHGISTVFGNTAIDNAQKIGEMMSTVFAPYSIPVYKGAKEALNLAEVETNAATDALADILKETKLRILAIGPATNVGILLLKNPELASQIEEVVLVAGRRKATDNFAIGNQGNNAPDLNFDLDNQAFQILLESGVPVTLCPFEISSKVWIKPVDLKEITTKNPANQWLVKHSQPWLQQWLDQGAEGFNPFDVLASHYLIAPDDIISEHLTARMEIHKNDQIKDNSNQHFKQYLLCDNAGRYPVKYCYDVVYDYHEKLIQTLKKD